MIEGTVIRGKGRGKGLGFPTANFVPTKKTDLTAGVYLAHTYLEDTKYPSLFFLGAPETFNETEWSYETHILDFDREIYNSELRIEILEKIRDNQKFNHVAELMQAIENDVAIARKFFKNL